MINNCRTVRQCRDRWKNSLNKTIKKDKWDITEEIILIKK